MSEQSNLLKRILPLHQRYRDALLPLLHQQAMRSDAVSRPSGNPSDPLLHPSSLFPVSLLAAAQAGRSRQQSASQHMSLRTLRGTGPQITPTSRSRSPGSCRHIPAEHAPLPSAETKTPPRSNVNLRTRRCSPLSLYRNSQEFRVPSKGWRCCQQRADTQTLQLD